MENIFIVAVLVTVFFTIIKFVEMKFVDKKVRPLKDVAKDVIIVFISALTAGVIYFNMDGSFSELMNSITETKIMPTSATTEIFTGNPEF